MSDIRNLKIFFKLLKDSKSPNNNLIIRKTLDLLDSRIASTRNIMDLYEESIVTRWDVTTMKNRFSSLYTENFFDVLQSQFFHSISDVLENFFEYLFLSNWNQQCFFTIYIFERYLKLSSPSKVLNQVLWGFYFGNEKERNFLIFGQLDESVSYRTNKKNVTKVRHFLVLVRMNLETYQGGKQKT